MKKQYLLGLIVLMAVSCSTLVRLPEEPMNKPVTESEALDAWAVVLKNYVNEKGQVNFRGLGAKPEPLLKVLSFVSATDRATFKEKNHRLAWYINAYNAFSMYHVIQDGYPDDLKGFFKRLSFFYNTKFIIFKEEMSLYKFENDLIRKEGDPRVHVALNCMSAGCPRLPREPFFPKSMEAQLEREALKFYNEERNVRTDDKEKKVYLSEILKFFTDDFLAKKPTLIDYVNQYRKQKVPADYKVEFIPYDWTIYKQ